MWSSLLNVKMDVFGTPVGIEHDALQSSAKPTAVFNPCDLLFALSQEEELVSAISVSSVLVEHCKTNAATALPNGCCGEENFVRSDRPTRDLRFLPAVSLHGSMIKRMQLMETIKDDVQWGMEVVNDG